MSELPEIFEKDGKFWVDTGHADVGPFDTRVEAKQHMDRILSETAKHSSVSEEDKVKLADLFQKLAGFCWWDDIYHDRKSARDVVDSVIEAGWKPN